MRLSAICRLPELAVYTPAQKTMERAYKEAKTDPDAEEILYRYLEYDDVSQLSIHYSGGRHKCYWAMGRARGAPENAEYERGVKPNTDGEWLWMPSKDAI